MIKSQESYDGYSLVDLYKVLKSDESEINEIVEEGKLSLGGPLTLMTKVTTNDSKIESVKEVKLEEEGFLVDSLDEVVAYYLNNKVKKFFKKPFNLK